ETAIDGWPVALSDTAGLRDAQHPIEAAGIEAARRQTAAADLRLLVFDRSAPFTSEDRELHATWPDALIVHNKSDFPPHPDPRPTGLAVSALTGAGIETLLHAIADRLVPNPPEPGAAVSFHARHVEALVAARGALARGDATSTIMKLRALLVS